MLIPCGHRVIVKPDEVEDKYGDIVIVQDEKLEQAGVNVGTIVAIGDTAWEAYGPHFTGKPWAAVGDRIYYAKYAGKNVEDPEKPEEKFVVLNDEDCVCKVMS